VLNARDVDAIGELLADEFELIEPSLLDAGVHRGLEGMVGWLGAMEEAWREMHWEPVELRDEGDWVVARVTFSSVGAQTGIRQEMQRFQTVRVAAGRVAFATGYASLDQALLAIGRAAADEG
jgi:SnoaL-like protein